MEHELKEAKACSSSPEMREKIYAIKSLCELILETQTSSTSVNTYNTTPIIQPVTGQQATNESNRLQIDEANGDSIFDF